jgi:hypothetical protein
MLIGLSTTGDSVNGRSQGLIVQRTAGRAIARTWNQPAPRDSTGSAPSSRPFAELLQEFATLTAAEQLAWSTYAAENLTWPKGRSPQFFGAAQAFAEYNANLIAYTSATIAQVSTPAAPTWSAQVKVEEFIERTSSTGFEIILKSAIAAPTRLLIFGQPPIDGPARYQRSAMRYLGAVDFTSAASIGDPIPGVDTLYAAEFGAASTSSAFRQWFLIYEMFLEFATPPAVVESGHLRSVPDPCGDPADPVVAGVTVTNASGADMNPGECGSGIVMYMWEGMEIASAVLGDIPDGGSEFHAIETPGPAFQPYDVIVSAQVFEEEFCDERGGSSTGQSNGVNAVSFG